jgi:alkylation response protein AidB-like acyl-CoA dehydrogenase
MSVDLELDEAARAVTDTVAVFCAQRCPDSLVKSASGSLPEESWRGLAELGVLAIATADGTGGALEVVAAMESLGRAVFPGPLAATFLAGQLLPEPERAAVATGEAIVSVGAPPLMPWAPLAQHFIELDGNRAWSARARGRVEPVQTLGGEPWGRVELERERELAPPARALALSQVALAAYLTAAGQRLVDDASEHARSRRQFGRAIGEFQAVAHPLADCAIRLSASLTLARVAAFHWDEAAATAPVEAALARLSASEAALEAAHVAHQVFGALGVTLEGPVFHVSRRIRQLASQPPAPEPARELVLEQLGL